VDGIDWNRHVFVLVAPDALAGLPSHQRLRLAKGGSKPVNAVPGTIRGDLGSINVMLALMHSADSPADSQRESAVFAGAAGFEQGEPVDLARQLALLELGHPAERRGYEAVVAGVRARMIVALWDELSPAARGVARALLDRGIPGLAEAEAGGELADMLEPAGHPLAPCCAAPSRRTARASTWTWCGPCSAPTAPTSIRGMTWCWPPQCGSRRAAPAPDVTGPSAPTTPAAVPRCRRPARWRAPRTAGASRPARPSGRPPAPAG
jgi:hypothetical protein